MSKKWNLKNLYDFESSYNSNLKLSRTMRQILKNRKILDVEEFLYPTKEILHNPFLLKGMDTSVDRIKNAIKNNEKICIYGDYDVDGVSSTSILMIYFSLIGYSVDYYIPNRLKEGYGINKDAISVIKDQGTKLIISVDCGISSIKEVDYVNELGIDIIITDHHECPNELPKAYSIINTKQNDCEYPFKHLCGCGIAFKLIQALLGEDQFVENINLFLPITALATVCDVVSLCDENRFIVKEGLRIMKDTQNLGLKNLIKVCGLEGEQISAYHVGYVIGPRINAAGRLGNSRLAVELFTTLSQDRSFEIAQILDEQNRQRQFTELQIHKEAEEIIKNNSNFENEKVIVIAKEGWNHGIVGIVSSRLTEKYYKPSILLSIENGFAKGSARSIKGFNIYEALKDSKSLIEKFGGHEQAAGLTLLEDNIEDLKESLNIYADKVLSDEDMVETLNCEFEIFEEDLNLKLCSELKLLEPFGMGNPSPKFVLKNASVSEVQKIGKNGDHLKLKLKKQGIYDCIAFAKGTLYDKIMKQKYVDIAFSVEENKFRNNIKMQLNIKDLRTSLNLNKLYMNIKYNDFKESDFKGNFFDLNMNINKEYEFQKNDIILVNNNESLEKLIFELENRNMKYNLNLNNITKKQENIHIIFIPHIDKIDFKRYNNIVILDFLYTIDDYNYICKNLSDGSEIYLLHKIDENDYTRNYIQNSIPTRDEMALVYRFLKSSKKAKFSYNEITDIIDMYYMKILNSIKIFYELELINLKLDDEEIIIYINNIGNKKVDLEESNILRTLKKIQKNMDFLYESIICKEDK